MQYILPAPESILTSCLRCARRLVVTLIRRCAVMRKYFDLDDMAMRAFDCTFIRVAETLNANPTVRHVRHCGVFIWFRSVAINRNQHTRRDHIRINHAHTGCGVRYDDIM